MEAASGGKGGQLFTELFGEQADRADRRGQVVHEPLADPLRETVFNSVGTDLAIWRKLYPSATSGERITGEGEAETGAALWAEINNHVDRGDRDLLVHREAVSGE